MINVTMGKARSAEHTEEAIDLEPENQESFLQEAASELWGEGWIYIVWV